MRPRGSDGRIRNDREIVTEHDAAHDAADHQRQGDAGLFGDSYGNRADGSGTADGGPRRRGDEAGDDKDTGRQVFRRNIGQAQIDRRVDAAHGLAGSREAAGHEVNDAHDNDVGIAASFDKGFKFFVKVTVPDKDKCRNRTDSRRQRGRELVECHFHAAHIENDTAAQVDCNEYDKGNQSQCVWLYRVVFITPFLGNGLFHLLFEAFIIFHKSSPFAS